MTGPIHRMYCFHLIKSQSAFVRGFIDDEIVMQYVAIQEESQSAFVRGFIDDGEVLGASA